jgi:hypothetical protein
MEIVMKIVTLTLAAFAASVTIASADTTNNISNLIQEQHRGGHVELGVVTAVADGTVEIHDLYLGEIGRELGSTDVSAGANLHAHVNIPYASRDVIALLKVNGQIVDTQELHFHHK